MFLFSMNNLSNQTFNWFYLSILVVQLDFDQFHTIEVFWIWKETFMSLSFRRLVDFLKMW